MAADTTTYSRLYGLNMKLQDSTHVFRMAIENGRWHEALIGLKDVHQHVRNAGEALKEIEPEGYRLLIEEVAKMERPAADEKAAKVAKPGDSGRVVIK